MSDQPAEKRIAVTVTSDQAQRLRALGAQTTLSTGLLSRALIEYALDRADDPGSKDAVLEYVTAVREADRARRRAVGARVMTERHSAKKKET
ncbi:hypothetical protein SAMN04488550_2904 [Gordonia malaquae]|uniref:Uncharacterized protein n=1 Tax=Gordonia malaquae NBRC 108250 TaxID=1223542 RepID=M3TBN1_GORML|nr:hypothetical protein [Gordonia malaquae]GAC78776.1 hypothetical protein GM1_004_02210 [Gordonia malaquae NBRC 108250]SED65543.1 hypothetical protein SAMN04488550_2904 [Gordonia malaquae]